MRIKNYILDNAIPSIFVLFVIIGIILSYFYDPSRYIDLFKEIYFKYDLLILFVVSLIEGFLFFGVYWFGGIIMFFATLFAETFYDVSMVVIVVWIALMIDSFFNYYVGFYFSKHNKKNNFSSKKLKKNFKLSHFFYFFHTTSVAYYCFNLGYNKKSLMNLIGVNLIVLLVCIFYAILITFFRGSFYGF